MIATLKILLNAKTATPEDTQIDLNDPPVLAQRLREAHADVDRSRSACASLIARRFAEDRRAENLTAEIVRREEQVRAALAAGQTVLANEVADRIIALEDRRNDAQIARQDLNVRISLLRQHLSVADRRIAEVAADLRTARAASCGHAATMLSAEAPPACLKNAADEMVGRLRSLDPTADDHWKGTQKISHGQNHAEPVSWNLNARDARALRRTMLLTRVSTEAE